MTYTKPKEVRELTKDDFLRKASKTTKVYIDAMSAMIDIKGLTLGTASKIKDLMANVSGDDVDLHNKLIAITNKATQAGYKDGMGEGLFREFAIKAGVTERELDELNKVDEEKMTNFMCNLLKYSIPQLKDVDVNDIADNMAIEVIEEIVNKILDLYGLVDSNDTYDRVNSFRNQ